MVCKFVTMIWLPKFAVYEETRISVTKYQTPAVHRVDEDLGANSEPCCSSAPLMYQIEFRMLNGFSRMSSSCLQGYGLNLFGVLLFSS